MVLSHETGVRLPVGVLFVSTPKTLLGHTHPPLDGAAWKRQEVVALRPLSLEKLLPCRENPPS